MYLSYVNRLRENHSRDHANTIVALKMYQNFCRIKRADEAENV